jgi:hypothetical protein
MILSGGDLGGQEYTEPCEVGVVIEIDGYKYRVVSDDMAVFVGTE